MAFSVIFRVPGQMSRFRGHFPPVSRFCAPLCRAGNSMEERLTAGPFSLETFYQKCPCPRKCPNGHKNGICVCFYPKSAISCRDCPMNPPKSLCTPPAKSYKFVSANPCKTDAGRINKYDYPGCVGGSFWNFIRFRDFPETLQNLSVSLPLDSSPEKGSPWQGGFVFDETDLRLLENVTECQSLS